MRRRCRLFFLSCVPRPCLVPFSFRRNIERKTGSEVIPKGVVRKKYMCENQMETRLTNAQSHMKNSEKTASIRPGTSGDPEARINVLFLCDEWKSSKGGLSTFNRELAINLAKSSSKRIIVHCYVSQSDELDREDAKQHGVNLFTAQRIPGSTDPLDRLKIPPPLQDLHVVIGHGRKFGVPAYFIVKNTKCKWIQFVHVFCEDLGKHKRAKRSTEDTIDENEDKHRREKELCEAADLVVGVGPSLQTKYQKCLPRGINVQVLTPGIIESFAPPLPELHISLGGLVPVPDHDQDAEFSVFMIGRLTLKDIFVKGFDVVARAIASLGEGFKLTIVGSPPAQQRRMEKWFLKNTKITREQLTIRRYCDQQELKGMFQEAHLVALPSNVEGFGLVALEAISAAVPVLVSKHSGIAKALETVGTGDSVVVTSQEPREWASKILQLSKQTQQERSENAIQLRLNYNSTYSWNAECERFESMIVNVLEAEAGPSQENIDKQPQEMQRSSERISHGKGKRPLPALSPNEVLQVKKARLDYHGPAVLQRVVWWHLSQLFGFLTPMQSRELKWGDVSLEKDPTTGNERLVLKAGCSLSQIQHETSAVQIYKEFLRHRPIDMNNPDSPFYLAVKQGVKPGDTVWYMRRPQAVNKI